MSPLAPSMFLLLQTAADSAGTRIVLEHTWLDTAAGVAQSLVSVLIVVMLVMGVLLLYALKKSVDELGKLIKTAYEPLRGAITEVREVTGEVRTLATGLKAPVAKAGETIDEASERFRAAMDVAEERLARLDALVDIAQEEAEGVVLGAASLVRGVRASGSAVRRSLGLLGRSGGRRRGADEDDTIEDDDTSDPDDADAHEGADSANVLETPRIRPRAGSSR